MINNIGPTSFSPCTKLGPAEMPTTAMNIFKPTLFKFHPALSLGCTAGARTTTAALGAIQEAVGSETPSLGYTVT